MPTIDIQKELDRFRENLIDLTNRNPLLNYRKSRRRTIEIIDELPDQIFDRLVGQGKSFRFDPLVDDDDEGRVDSLSGDAAPAQGESESETPMRLADPPVAWESGSTRSLKRTSVQVATLSRPMPWPERSLSTPSNAPMRPWEWGLSISGKVH